MLSIRQKKDESTNNWCLLTKNRLQVYTAISWTVLFPGMAAHASQEQYGKGYEYLSTTEKQACAKFLIERMMAMILFKNANSDRFGKLQKEIHDDHLKSQDKSVSLYQKTTTGVQ